MNDYQKMRNRQQREFNMLPLGFAFNRKQFNEMMRGWGLHPERDVKEVTCIGNGGYIQKMMWNCCARRAPGIRRSLRRPSSRTQLGMVSSSRCSTAS